jgi:hypothetical protein
LKRYAVAVYQKILWFVAAALPVGLGFWLETVMPSQGWAQWDGKRWQVVAESWAVLWRGWPLAVLGALVGFSAAWIGLAFALQHAKEADFRAKIARLTRQRDAAVADAEARVLEREQAARDRGAVALAAQRAAELATEAAQAARQRAEQAQQDAQEAVSQATLRARNAVCAAERIKRRIEGKKRLEIETSAP